MSSDFVAGLFLLAFWLPPLAVVAGALALFVRVPTTQRTPSPIRRIGAAPVSH